MVTYAPRSTHACGRGSWSTTIGKRRVDEPRSMAICREGHKCRPASNLSACGMVLPRSSGTAVLPLPPHAEQLSRPNEHEATRSQRPTTDETYTRPLRLDEHGAALLDARPRLGPWAGMSFE